MGALADRYDCFLLDLDGVLYRGDQPVPGAPEMVENLRRRGKRVAFVTNNSSRTPEQVADKLRRVGIEARPGEVVSSAVATASALTARGIQTAFVIGETGIRSALAAAGVQVLDGEPERADCVVVGFDSSADYARLRRAALLAQRGALLVATNADGSYPTPDGMWPGAGALLAAVTTTVGRPADEVVGKPHPTLYRTALQAAGGGTPLVVGDRLDTDIAGAGPLGWDSLLVFTGVARPPDLLATAVLPTYVAEDLSGLERDAPVIRRARREDTSGIEALLAHSGLNAQGVDERIEDTLVAEGEREPAGTASLELFGEIVHLRSVAVDERYRGRHVGALLVANAARLARERKGRELYAVTEDAAGFFQGLGFVPIGTRDSLPRPVAATPMVRDQCSIGSVALRLSLA